MSTNRQAFTERVREMSKVVLGGQGIVGPTAPAGLVEDLTPGIARQVAPGVTTLSIYDKDAFGIDRPLTLEVLLESLAGAREDFGPRWELRRASPTRLEFEPPRGA